MCPIIPFSFSSGLQAELDFWLQVCSVSHSREKVLARGLACAHWTVFPLTGGLRDDQDSFTASLDHSSVALWYLSSLPPHAVAGSRLHSFWWAEHPTSLPGRLYGRTERACSPDCLKRAVMAHGYQWGSHESSALASITSAQGKRASPVYASRCNCIQFVLIDQYKS